MQFMRMVAIAIGLADGIHLTVVHTDRDPFGASFRPGRAIAVNVKSTQKPPQSDPLRPSRGRVDVERLHDASEAQIAAASPPELKNLPPDFWNDAAVVPASK